MERTANLQQMELGSPFLKNSKEINCELLGFILVKSKQSTMG